LILGLDNAGKTTVLRRICGEDESTISRIEPTLGFNIQTLQHGDYHLNLWDVGGQRSIRAYWRNYFEQTDGLVWVVDSADAVRLELCRQELEALLTEERLAGASLLILANKQDVPSALSSEEIANALGLNNHGNKGDDSLSLLSKRHWNILGCSAVSGDGLVEGMDWIVQDIANRIFMLD